MTATQKTVASFSFDISPLKNRKYIYPDRVSFDTTGRIATTTPVPAYSGDFIQWDNGYPVNSWTRLINNVTQSTTRQNYIQVCQFPYNYAIEALQNKMLVCGMTVGSAHLIYGIANSINDVVDCYSGDINSSCSTKAFATVISSTKAYCFWVYKPASSEPVLKMSYFNGSTWASEIDIPGSAISDTWGVSGCLIKEGNNEYIAVAFPTANNRVSLLTFKDGNHTSYKITSGIEITNNISGAQITITQNPRTGKIYLGWISGDKAFYKIGNFDYEASTCFAFSSEEIKICSVSDSKATYASISAGSYNNFETSFTISDDSYIRNYCLCGDRAPIEQILIHETGSTSFLKFATAFQYFQSGNYYSGCLCSSGFKTINLFSRLLEYPKACSWQAEKKTLHLEGPPRVNTQVVAQIDFAEMVPSETYVRCVNSEFVGGVRPFNNSFAVVDERAVIASSSGCFLAIGFDKSMNAASFSSEISSSVRLKESGTGINVPIAYIASSSNKLVFKPVNDLKFNTSYVVNIASDIVDIVGSQIYKNETLTFKTQQNSSSLDSAGVIKLEAFADPGYSNQILSGSDVKADTKIYFRLNAYDPAFNTIDTTTLRIKKSGNILDSISLKQKEASSDYFYGEYQLTAPLNEDSTWLFETIDSSKNLSLRVDYPIFTPSSPASGSIGLNPTGITKIEISASEELDLSSINSDNISLMQLSSLVSSSINYDSLNKKITITPNSVLSSEKNYLVIVKDILDKAGNKQIEPLVYYFSTSDITKPELLSCYPLNNATDVTIDSKPYIAFSEEILSATVTKSNIKVTCNGVATDYSLINSGNNIFIVFENGLKPESLYKIDVTTGITDFSGNSLVAPFSYKFSTQNAHTAPTSVSNLTLYRNESMFDVLGNKEKINADSTIYFKLNAVDGATQTLDIATISILLNSSVIKDVTVFETASNSGGLFTGKLNLSELGLYSFSSIVPAQANNELSFRSTINTSIKADLITVFPEIINSGIDAVAGYIPVNSAVNVYVDSAINLEFSDELNSESINETSIVISSGSVIIPCSRVLSDNKKNIKIIPEKDLPLNSIISLKLPYSVSGLKDITGNPIKGAINYSFKTQDINTAPTSISEIDLYSDSSMSAIYKYIENQDFNANAKIYIEVKGGDGAHNTIDTTTVTVNGSEKISLIETGNSTGIYRGFYQCNNYSDGVLKITSDINTAVSRSLMKTTPSLISISPASGTVGISKLQAFHINYSEPLAVSTVKSDNIKIRKRSNGDLIPCDITYLEGTTEIILRPLVELEFLTDYELIVENLTDMVGNKASSFVALYTIQASSSKPDGSDIISLRLYEDFLFTSEIATGSIVAPGSSFIIKVDAVDPSSTTVDNVIVKIIDHTNNEIKSLSLIETGENTGIFIGVAEACSVENSFIEVLAEDNVTKSVGITTDAFPVYVSFSPASGTTGLFLDNQFIILANKNIDASTITKSSVVLEGVNGTVDYTPSCIDNKLLINLISSLPGDKLRLTLTSALRDEKGLNFPATTAIYETKTKYVTSFNLYSNSAFTNLLPTGSNVEAGQQIYCEIIGSNLTQTALTDTMDIVYADNDIEDSFVASEVAAGKYRGSFIVPNSSGKELLVNPVDFSDKAVKLNILEPFVLLEHYPASGSIGIPADAWMTWTFSRIIPESQLNLSNFSLYDVNTNSSISGKLSLSPSKKQVRFEPNNVLEALKTYEMRLSASVCDMNGNLLEKGLDIRFTTQPPPLPPTNLMSFGNYSDESFENEATAVFPNGILFLQMVAEDPSFSTYESAHVRMDSDDGTYDGVTLTLVETNPPSGIFRLKLPVNLPVGSKITLTPQVDDSFKIQVIVKAQAGLSNLSPASGSTNIFLDSNLEMDFTTALNTESFKNSVTVVDSNNQRTDFSCKFVSSDKKAIITFDNQLLPDTTYFVNVNGLKDKDGQGIKPFVYKFLTKKELEASFELYTGISPCDGKPVSKTSEIVKGLLGIVASTTDMLLYSQESRTIRLSDASHSVDINLNETALNSNLYVASTSIDSSFTSPIKAELLFGSKPQMVFNIASPTYLVSVIPSENSETFEDSLIEAVYSRKINIGSALEAVKIGSENSETDCELINYTEDSEKLIWRPKQLLSEGNKHTLSISGLIDYLGQSVSNYNHQFFTDGTNGINLYSDYSFKNKITSKEISLTDIYVEVVASSPKILNKNDVYLEIVRGTLASESIKLKIEPVDGSNKLFRCALKLAKTKSTMPSYLLELVPGEWVKIKSPLLTSGEILFYYRFSSDEQPQCINGINFFSDKNYIRKVVNEISNPSLYIDVNAEDLNWFTRDITKVKVYSDDDKTGFIMDLFENGIHSNSFRGMVTISEKTSNPITKTLKVSFGKRITVVSVTDPAVKATIRYFPKAEIINFSAYPNPTRRNYVNFRFYLNFPTEISVSIYDVSGAKIDTFEINGKEGENNYRWNFPRKMANGVYIYRVKSLGKGEFYTYAKKVKGKFAVLK